MTAFIRSPVRISLQKFDIEAIETPGRLDIDRVILDRFDGRDACERKKETEMVREVAVVANADVAFDKVFGLKCLAIGRQNEADFSCRRFRAGTEFRELRVHLARLGNGEMDILVLKDAALNVGIFRCARQQALYRRRLVVEGFKESTRKLFCIKGCRSKFRYGFFNLNGVHESVSDLKQVFKRR